MSYAANGSQEYLRNAVLTATPAQLQLMLYDGAIRFATKGLEAMRAGDRMGQFNNFDRAQRIVLEMANGLNRTINPELADQMAALYSFIYRRLVKANVDHDEQALDEAMRILRHQRETWVLLMERLRQEANPTTPPSANTQSQPATPKPSGIAQLATRVEKNESFCVEG